jgi:hypothetical protein
VPHWGEYYVTVLAESSEGPLAGATSVSEGSDIAVSRRYTLASNRTRHDIIDNHPAVVGSAMNGQAGSSKFVS